MIDGFAEWLAATALCQTIQNTPWAIPALQTIHILALAFAFTSIAMLDVRMMGLLRSEASPAEVVARFLPWTWGGVIALTVSGVILVIGEPDRALPNPVFQAKMFLVAVALGVTALRGRAVRRTNATRVVAVLSLSVWIAIVIAGRWIAYVDTV